jgi:thiol peroxidase
MPPFRLLYGEDILPIIGDFPGPGSLLPSFMLVGADFNDVALAQFTGVPKVIITLLSLDEDVHGGMRLLRETLRTLEHWPQLQVIVVTVDSPSTLRRVHKTHGLPNTILLSTLRGRDFHKHFGVLITEYPLAGYTAPALILADANNQVLHSQRLRDTLDDFELAPVHTIMQERAAAEAEARRLAEEQAQREREEALENEREELAAVDAAYLKKS